jgi:hypothetical protein
MKFNKYTERDYWSTSDSIHLILDSLDRSRFSLSNEYKFMCVAYSYEKLLKILSWELYLIF